eukprot:2918959-Pyramimonas_sp.AAC.1
MSVIAPAKRPNSSTSHSAGATPWRWIVMSSDVRAFTMRARPSQLGASMMTFAFCMSKQFSERMKLTASVKSEC